MKRQAEAKTRRDAKPKLSPEQMRLVRKHGYLKVMANETIHMTHLVLASTTVNSQAKVYAVEIENLTELLRTELQERNL